MTSTLEFRKLWFASFISQIGSHFLTLSLSAFVLINTQSAVLSSLVFVFSFLPSVVIGPKVGHWIDARITKWLIARNELVSIVTTVLCGACIALGLPIFVLCALLGVRSILLFIGRAASTKWLKLITPPTLQIGRNKLLNLAFFLSTAVAGLLASQVLAHASIWAVVAVDVVTYLCGLVLFLTLKSLPDENVQASADSAPMTNSAPTLTETLKHIVSIPTLRTSFLLVCFSQAIFQGAYSALVSFLPIRHFNVGTEGIGWFQIAASIGITSGFIANWIAPKLLSERETVAPFKALIFSLVAIASLIVCVASPTIQTSLIMFLTLNFTYECIWLHHSSEFFRASPRHHAARYQFSLSSTAAFFMSLVTLLYALAVEYLGVLQGVASVVVATSIVATISFYLTARPVVATLRSEERA